VDNLLYISASGAKENLNGLAVRAHNLANAKTDGFRADLEQARAMQAFGEGLPTRVFSMTESPRSDFRPGPIITTERQLDMAIKGEGFFVVYDENGQEKMTRYGAFKVAEDGLLLNQRDQVVVGVEGPIYLGVPANEYEISDQGVVMFRPPGAPVNERAIAGQLKMLNPPIENLMKHTNGLIGLKDVNDNQIPLEQVDPYNDILLERYALEGSNVNPVSEMVALISLQRQFEMQVKMMKTAEEIEATGAQLMKTS